MTKSNKIIISLLVPALSAGLWYCFYLLADAGMLGETFGMIAFIPTIFLFLEHLLIGRFLYGLGIGWKTTLPGAGLNDDYLLGWILAVLIDYLILSALTYSILLILENLKSSKKAE